MRKLFSIDNTGLFALLLVDGYITWSYIADHAIFDDVIIIFYIQSVLIGVFNALDIFTVSNLADKNAGIKSSRGCTGLFFLFHYGMFHLVYLFFLPSLITLKNVHWHFVLMAFYLLAASCLTNFIQNKMRNRHQAMNISVMFFLPYARVIPMHITILAPKFLNITAPVVFLILKTLADIITWFVYKRALFKPVTGVNNT
ncbi:MAG TPA: DUF6498-containing protein [Chitinophagaceae bacterium]|nr:DUF6498-containing protein [Chitinophagaceae bacterium]